MNALAIALDLATRDLPVFPCGRNKRPAISEKEGGRGLHDATSDPATIRRMFNRRNAVLVGVPTGEASGFDALDLDYRHGAEVWEQANLARIPETRMHETPSGGRHLLFHHAFGVRNSASRIAAGVDVRGEGGYIIHPPSTHYSVISDAPIAHWPDWLLPLALPAPKPDATPRQSGPRTPLSDERLEAIKKTALDRVRRAPDGGKHFTLRNSARLLGGIQQQAGFTQETAIKWLLDELPDGVKDLNNAEKTAAWGLEHGRHNPIEVEERREHHAPDPRRKAIARAAFRMLRAGLAGPDLLAALHEQNEQSGEPLPRDDIGATALWAAQRLGGQADAR